MREIIFDTESNGFVEQLTKIHCIALTDPETGAVRSFGGHTDEKVRGVLSHLEAADVLVGHNILKHDIPALQKVYPAFKPRGEIRDTVVCSRLIWPEIANLDFSFIRKGKDFPTKLIGKHSLKAWGYRLGELKGAYAESDEGEDAWANWTQEMQDYCEQDVRVTKKLWALIKSKNYSQTAITLEHEFQKYIAWQEAVGFPFDEAAAKALYAELAARRNQLEKELLPFFPPWEVRTKFTPRVNSKKLGYVRGVEAEKVKTIHFNPRSHDHIAQRLIKQRGWEPVDFTDSGKPKTDGEILNRLGKEWPECALLSEHVEIQKIIGMLAEGKHGWLKVVKNGRIHGKVITNGAVTGRCAHFAPNLGQIPKEGDLGKRCRALFTSIPGYKLVGADASGLELRCLGHYMAKYDGGTYITIVTTGDVHTANQHAAGLPTRSNAKTFIYAFLYGAGGWKIGVIVGVTDEEIEHLKQTHPSQWKKAIKTLEKRKMSASPVNTALEVKGNALKDRFLKNLPALKLLKDAIAETVRQRGYLVGLDGRHLNIRSPHSALNTLLQSAGALLVKVATVFFHSELSTRGWDKDGTVYPVVHVHDEVQIMVREGREKEVGELFVHCIQRAGEFFKFRCPLDGEWKAGENWKDTH